MAGEFMFLEVISLSSHSVKWVKELQNGSAHAVGASYSGLYEEGEVEHINVFSLAS